MATRDPSPVAILAARLQRAYPALSPYSAASLAEDLAKIERAQRRHAERCCNGADGGYVKWSPCPGGHLDGKHREVEVHDPAAEERARVSVFNLSQRWRHRLAELAELPAPGPKPELETNPYGAVLKIRLPGETEATSV